MIAHRDGDVMVLATGDSKPIEWQQDGAWFACPWCRTGQKAHEDTCPNPACVASQWANEQYVRDVFARLTAEDARRERARDEVEALARSDAASRAARQAAWSKAAHEASERGACLVCLRKSPWEGGHPRFVRHRNPDHHGRSTA
ncbi:hypothetical protein [Parafrankia sp. FMc2]|uniref:hypothetical protein n=1 Tax=Parafrankia sp. FMc2 TaxID=3233196 RepID=UPI0034D4485C